VPVDLAKIYTGLLKHTAVSKDTGDSTTAFSTADIASLPDILRESDVRL
jgi:hypothetical protein